MRFEDKKYFGKNENKSNNVSVDAIQLLLKYLSDPKLDVSRIEILIEGDSNE